MQLRFQEFDDFLVFNKPFGVRTHKVDTQQYGFIEYLSEKLAEPLFVVHRLDKETSGLIIFARNKEAAADLTALFEKQQIKKTYYFLTDKKIADTTLKVDSHIEKQNEFFVNNPDLKPNSSTSFEFQQQQGSYYLWKAEPHTGKPHQIRLHAQLAGIPVLGDNQHGGSIWHRLCLHSQKIEFSIKNKKHEATCDIPPFTNLFEDCFYSRHELYKINKNESYRLIHLESENIRADVFHDRLWIYDYTSDGLSKLQTNDLQKFASEKKLIPLVRRMLNRGAGVGGKEKTTLSSEDESPWTAKEESVQYRLKTDSGFSPGIFLDQRENRKWVKENSKNKDVLNLFSYTAGFSVNAAMGNAAQVTTVDVSKKFIEWSKENFRLNDLDTEKYEFFAQDSLLFLKGSIKRKRKWDLIVCDPPSFGRSKDSVWKLEQNLPELAKLMFECLNKNGKILFTCNLEKRSLQDIEKLFTKNLKKTTYQLKSMPMLCLDYEVTDSLKNLMKGFILTKV